MRHLKAFHTALKYNSGLELSSLSLNQRSHDFQGDSGRGSLLMITRSHTSTSEVTLAWAVREHRVCDTSLDLFESAVFETVQVDIPTAFSISKEGESLLK